MTKDWGDSGWPSYINQGRANCYRGYTWWKLCSWSCEYREAGSRKTFDKQRLPMFACLLVSSQDWFATFLGLAWKNLILEHHFNLIVFDCIPRDLSSTSGFKAHTTFLCRCMVEMLLGMQKRRHGRVFNCVFNIFQLLCVQLVPHVFNPETQTFCQDS